MKRYLRLGIVAVAALSILAIPRVSGAQILQGITLERLGLLWNPGAGARPYAMGGAYTAVSDDAFALIYNPAGLADIRSTEVSIGIRQRRDEITNKYLALSSTQTSSYTSLDHAAAVYPLPARRQNLVFAFGAFQAGSADFESIKSAYLADIPAAVENDLLQSGTIYQYHFGFGFDLSPRVALGGSLVLWDASIDFTDEIDYADADSSAFWRDDVSVNLDGVSFNLGLLVRANDLLRLGLMVSSPAWLTFDGHGVTTYDVTYPGGGVYTAEPERGRIHDDYTLPMKFSGGAALRLGNVTLAGDVGYTDYSQTKFNGLFITSEVDPGMERVLQETWSYHVGAEATLPEVPVSVRAGFSYVPLALSTIEEVAYISEDVPNSIVADFEAQHERKFFTFGVGGVIDGVLGLDAGVAIGGYEIMTSDSHHVPILTEKRSIADVIVSGTYRF